MRNPTIKLACLLVLETAVALPAFAQNAEKNEAGIQDAFLPQSSGVDKCFEIKLNQPFESKKLGNMMLPFMWDVVDDAENMRVVATQSRSHAPGVLTVDLITYPEKISGEQASDAMIQGIAEKLGGRAVLTRTEMKASCEPSKGETCGTLLAFQSEINGEEEGVRRRCAMMVVPDKGKAVVLSLCVAASQTYSPDLKEILEQVFWSLS